MTLSCTPHDGRRALCLSKGLSGHVGRSWSTMTGRGRSTHGVTRTARYDPQFGLECAGPRSAEISHSTGGGYAFNSSAYASRADSHHHSDRTVLALSDVKSCHT